jgi:hypothetical protein
MNPNIGINDAITNPISRPLIRAFGFFAGLRFLLGILERETVIIIARNSIVRLLLTGAVRRSPGKIPEKLVISEIINARLIMNALLVISFKASLMETIEQIMHI